MEWRAVGVRSGLVGDVGCLLDDLDSTESLGVPGVIWASDLGCGLLFGLLWDIDDSRGEIDSGPQTDKTVGAIRRNVSCFYGYRDWPEGCTIEDNMYGVQK